MAAAIDPVRTAEIVDEIIPKVLWEVGVTEEWDPTWVLADISWTTDPDVWEAARKELADIIEGGSLNLHGAPADGAIHLTWEPSGTLPSSHTWHIDYYTQTASVYTATEPLSTTRSTVLTEHVQNYQWYTVTLNAMVDSTVIVSDTVRVMPTDILVHLPLMMKED
jgi:hypothetical protein